MADDPTPAGWFIDLDWLEQNNRSFSILARDCLCLDCRQRLEKSKQPFSPADLIATIRDCCCKTPEFFMGRLPVLESVFRIFLANGNRPLTLEELSRQLGARRVDAPQRISPEVLSHLLRNERYYGLRQVASTLP
jgi:hypothetical protein